MEPKGPNWKEEELYWESNSEYFNDDTFNEEEENE